MRPPMWAQEHDPADMHPEPPSAWDDADDNADGRHDPQPPHPADHESFIPGGMNDPDSEVF